KANTKLTKNSQHLRKNMTKEERHLWYDFLKSQTCNFNRQKVIGDYIVDFYCAKEKLVIELDGSQHYEEKGKENDTKRDQYLSSLGITVLRYSNYDINTNFEGVCYDISGHINTSSTASGPPSPQGEGR
ncbi:MAG: endonuclease domain-containing protein, partial [Acutalibacteraceae bacterium]|nr:endonuclease domain-containing protein [Acutalibacteraceae bacterium]